MNPTATADPHHLPAVPVRMARLPCDAGGLPIPWWAPVGDDGKPDYRRTDRARYQRALDLGLCWICGQQVGKFKAFVLFPQSALLGVSTQPQQHRDCALFAAARCPFMAIAGTPRSVVPPVPSIGIVLVYVSTIVSHSRRPDGLTSILIGTPRTSFWFAGGRRLVSSGQLRTHIEATRPAVLAAAGTGAALDVVGWEYAAVAKLVNSLQPE